MRTLVYWRPWRQTRRRLRHPWHLQHHPRPALSQGGKAVGDLCAIGQQGFIAKVFAAGSMTPLPLPVQRQRTVVSLNPGGVGADGVAVAVELNASGRG